MGGFVSHLRRKNHGGHGGSAGPAMPTDNLHAWWHAGAGITKDASDYVSSWEDQENGYLFEQATGSKQPQWIDSLVNTYPALRFDGVDDLLFENWGDLGGNVAIYIIFEYNGPDGGGGVNYPIFASDNPFWGSTFWIPNAGGSGYWYPIANSTSNPGAGGWFIMGASRNAGPGVTHRLRLNDDGELTGTYYNTNVTQGGYLANGGAHNGSWYAEVDIAEVIVYSVQHSTAQMTEVLDYANGKYSLWV